MSEPSPKPLWVYLPGMDGTGELFNRQAEVLAPYYEILALKLPRVETWAELVEWVLRQLPAHRPFYLCGESFGGCLALLVALNRLPQGLILVNPASSFARLGWLSWLSQALPLLPEGLWNQSSPESLRVLADRDRISPSNWQRFQAAVSTVDKATACTRVKLLRQFPNLDLQTLSCPTVILASDRDRLLPSVAEAQRLAQQLPAATIYPLPASGHACLLEADLNLAAILGTVGWLSEATSPSLIASS